MNCGLVAQFLRRKGLSIQWLRKGTTTVPTRPSGPVRCVVAWHPQPRVFEPCPQSLLFVGAKAYESDVYGKAPRLGRLGQVARSVAQSLGTRNRAFLNHAGWPVGRDGGSALTIPDGRIGYDAHRRGQAGPRVGRDESLVGRDALPNRAGEPPAPRFQISLPFRRRDAILGDTTHSPLAMHDAAPASAGVADYFIDVS